MLGLVEICLARSWLILIFLWHGFARVGDERLLLCGGDRLPVSRGGVDLAHELLPGSLGHAETFNSELVHSLRAQDSRLFAAALSRRYQARFLRTCFLLSDKHIWLLLLGGDLGVLLALSKLFLAIGEVFIQTWREITRAFRWHDLPESGTRLDLAQSFFRPVDFRQQNVEPVRAVCDQRAQSLIIQLAVLGSDPASFLLGGVLHFGHSGHVRLNRDLVRLLEQLLVQGFTLGFKKAGLCIGGRSFEFQWVLLVAEPP